MMPDGTPAPYVLTGERLLAFLGKPAPSREAARKAVRLLIAKGLRGYRDGGNRFTLPEVLDWLRRETERNPA